MCKKTIDIEYEINQYPKNKNIDLCKLNDYQIIIRNNQKKYKYKKTFTCRQCFIKQCINEFYVKDKKTGRRDRTCRDCRMKNSGVLNIGKQRFSDKIGEKGFRRCSVCKTIKPLSEYSNQKNKYLGKASNCKKCNSKLVKNLQKTGQKEITDWYVREYGKRIGVNEFNEEIIIELRNKILESRKPKYFLDNLSFVTLRDFAKYVEKKYNIPITTTEKRIFKGKKEEDCKISESKMRSVAHTKGKIKVTDTITKNILFFENTRDKKLLEMFSKSTISRTIKTGKPTRITKLSKYKNPCLIERV